MANGIHPPATTLVCSSPVSDSVGGGCSVGTKGVVVGSVDPGVVTTVEVEAMVEVTVVTIVVRMVPVLLAMVLPVLVEGAEVTDVGADVTIVVTKVMLVALEFVNFSI